MKHSPEFLEGSYGMYSPFIADAEHLVEDLKDSAFDLLREVREPVHQRAKNTYLASKLLLSAAIIDELLINGSGSRAALSPEERK